MPTVDFSSVLILRLSALGDLIHTLPAVAAIRRLHPKAKIGWVAERAAAVLLENNPLVDRVHTIDTRSPRRWRTFARGTLDIIQAVEQLRREHYDLALDFQGLFKSAVLARLSGARRRLGLAGPLRREALSASLINEPVSGCEVGRHVIELHGCLVEALGITMDPWEFPLPQVEQQTRYVTAQLEQLRLEEFAVVNPGAGWVSKQWAPEKYARLADLMEQELGLTSFFSWGPGEERLVHEIGRMTSRSQALTFPTKFLDLIPLLKQARIFIGGDTGPMQLAAAVGIPIVAIFGPTTPSRNGPFHKQDIVVHRELFCSNCYLRKCPYNMECLDITVEEVFAAVKERLDRIESQERNR